MKDAAVHVRRFFLSLLTIFLLSCVPLAAENTGVSTVTIEKANRTEYIKDPGTEDELISFTGDVSLKVVKNDQTILIQADAVTFNRTRSTLYAEGNITFSRETAGSSSENLTARTLLFNIDTLEGIFDEGRVTQEHSDSINLPSGSSLYVSSDLFGRDNSGTVAFDSGTLTFCDDPDPHWKIRATRIWLLPGSEFSFFNAVLYVGHLPVMYFPFFYYPKDEMIFNPVFSYDERRGYSLQTTTYIIGRKPLPSNSDDDGLFSFMRTTELKKQEREGLFLRNLDEKDTAGPNTFKIMADLYSNLGVMAGTEGTFKPDSVISDLSFKTYFGFSNTIFQSGGQYTTFSPVTAERYKDSSYLLGMKIPFRFYGDLSLKLSTKAFSLNLSLPVYSDAYFASDFLNRSESMDWINYLLKNPVLLNDSGSSSSSSGNAAKSDFTWKLGASFSAPAFIKSLNPFITEFRLSSLDSSLNFKLKDNASVSAETKNYAPDRTFYYPASLYPVKASLSIAGTLLSSSESAGKSAEAAKKAEETASGSSEAEIQVESRELILPDALAVAEEELPEYETIPADQMPALSFPGLASKKISDLTYSLTYSLSPSISTEMYYNSDVWHAPNEIDWDDIASSYLSVKSPVTVKDSISWKNSFISLTNTFSFLPEYQNHPVVSEDVYPEGSTKLDDLRIRDYQARKLDLSVVTALTFKPFVLTEAFQDTSLTWNSTVKLIRTNFTGTAKDPEWEYLKAKWDSDSVTSHDMTLVLGAKFGQFSPKLTLKANLPPQTESYTGTASFGYGVLSSFSLSTTLKRAGKDDDTWVYTPLTQSSSWSFAGKKLSLSQNYSYNIEDAHSDSLSLSLSGFGFKASYSMGWARPYELVAGSGWIIQQESDFIPKSASLSYAMPSKTFYSWFNRISFAPSLSTSVNADLLRPTESSFVFTPAFTFRINKALDITFSAESRNQVFFRYFQDFYGYDAKMPGETNMFVDLFNSFAFWDTDLRKSSGFKLKRISIKLSHELHDWVLNSEFRVEPRLLKDESPYRYDFSPFFTLSVVWRPMSSMKTTIQDKYGTFVLNPE